MEVFYRQGVCKDFAEFKEKVYVRVSFLMGKKDSDTVVFMWILGKIEEHLYYRTPPHDCFCDVFWQSMIINNSYNKPSYSLSKD